MQIKPSGGARGSGCRGAGPQAGRPSGGRPRRRLDARIFPFRNSWPPQTPHGSRRAMAPSRQGTSTGQSAHSRLAAAMSCSSSEKNRAVRPGATGGAEGVGLPGLLFVLVFRRTPVRSASVSPCSACVLRRQSGGVRGSVVFVMSCSGSETRAGKGERPLGCPSGLRSSASSLAVPSSNPPEAGGECPWRSSPRSWTASA